MYIFLLSELQLTSTTIIRTIFIKRKADKNQTKVITRCHNNPGIFSNEYKLLVLSKPTVQIPKKQNSERQQVFKTQEAKTSKLLAGFAIHFGQ